MEQGIFPRRGDVHWVELDPGVGAEMKKTRPCVILTNDIVNQRRRTVVMIPLTSTSPKKFPLYVELPSVGGGSQAVIDQMRVVDKSRIGQKIGKATQAEMEMIAEAVKAILDIE